MSLKYALHLTRSERQWLTRIAQGRGGPPRPAGCARALLKCDAGPAGAGETDAAVAVALDVSAGSMGRWRRQAVAEGPRGRDGVPGPGAAALQLAQSVPPAGYARWTLRLLARELAARGVGPRISHETVRRTLKNKLTYCCRGGAAPLSARARGSVRGIDGGCWTSTAGPTMRAIR